MPVTIYKFWAPSPGVTTQPLHHLLLIAENGSVLQTEKLEDLVLADTATTTDCVRTGSAMSELEVKCQL